MFPQIEGDTDMTKEPVVIENNGLDEPPESQGERVKDESVENALLAEREAYEKRGLTERVAAVDKELERLGYRGSKQTTRSEPVAETAHVKERK
jgi:hypothetical protein